MAVLAGIVLFIFIIYEFVYSPLVEMNISKEQELKEKIATLSWMQETENKKQELSNEKPITSGKLLSIIATELNKKPFSAFPHQIQQTSQGNIQLSFETVPFNAFLAWLWNLQNTYVIIIKQLDASRTPKAGVVKLMVLIDVNP
jgi:general secretion pathway protein M